MVTLWVVSCMISDMGKVLYLRTEFWESAGFPPAEPSQVYVAPAQSGCSLFQMHTALLVPTSITSLRFSIFAHNARGTLRL